METQSYSSLDNRDRYQIPVQTVIAEWYPHQIQQTHQTDARRHVFTIEEAAEEQSTYSKQTICCIDKDACVIFRLIITCIVLSVSMIAFLGYGSWTGFEIYKLLIETEDMSPSDLWKHTGESTLCVSVSGKDLRHSGCAKYLFHDISDVQNYTCCVRDSRQYSFLYQLIIQEQRRLTSAVHNTYCSHSNAINEVLPNDTLPFNAAKSCELNGKQGDDPQSSIEISSSHLYIVYLSLTVKFEGTFRDSIHNRVRFELIRRDFNGTSSHFYNDETLLHRVIHVRKERQNFETIFMYAAFYLEKGDKLFVEVRNKKYLYAYNTYNSLGLFQIQ